jgi:hypothetical protein
MASVEIRIRCRLHAQPFVFDSLLRSFHRAGRIPEGRQSVGFLVGGAKLEDRTTRVGLRVIFHY